MTFQEASLFLSRILSEHPELAPLRLEVAGSEWPIDLENTISLVEVRHLVPRPYQYRGAQLPKEYRTEQSVFWGTDFYGGCNYDDASRIVSTWTLEP